MATKIRGAYGWLPAIGEGFPVRVNLRVSKLLSDRLSALLPDSGDRMDFIRAAIAEKLECNKLLSEQEI